MATAESEAPAADDVLANIAKQHGKIESMRKRHRDKESAEVKRLAQMIADTRDHPDPDVNYSTAAKAMGVVRSYTQGLARKLERGEL